MVHGPSSVVKALSIFVAPVFLRMPRTWNYVSHLVGVTEVAGFLEHGFCTDTESFRGFGPSASMYF